MTTMPSTPDPVEAFQLYIEMLRAELRNCTNRKERAQIEAELAAAHDALTTYRRLKSGAP